MRHIADPTRPFLAIRRGQVRARIAVMDDGRARAFKILRLMLPLALLLFLALGQTASAHQAGSQHQPHAMQTMSHHAEADISCCDDLSQDEAACQARCLASCSYCTPLPLPTAFPDLTTISPAPARTEPLHGAIASPHLRPPSIS
ncbi:hypothetical protein [Aminobacter aminovorans]|uniref:Uncharacterized protein n=1 Tax=Aminobacter aminovorans TaxID=83263 RepID=A0AAC8YMA9_AMIAI|nr:hypothetical protein [Aminobacter aminovorans]AMS40579.1 hypothetical protein AA2016_1647 [Aminobacter aminovorans]MBB3706486.1 hypothetical protein [Aminobacter aminovorans]